MSLATSHVFWAMCLLAGGVLSVHPAHAQTEVLSPPEDHAPASVNAPAVPASSSPPPLSTCGAAQVPGPSRSSDAPPCVTRKPPNSDRVPDVASLKTPESPAFMALGVTPSDIQRPTTPTGLKASLANGFAGGGSLPLLQNFALEFSPFWLFPHRDLSFEKLVSEPQKAFYRNASISLATSPKDEKVTRADGTSATVTYGRFSAGARITLWPGEQSKGALACVQYLKQLTEQTSLQRGTAEQVFMATWLRANKRPEATLPPKPTAQDGEAAQQKYRAKLEAAEAKLAPAIDDWEARLFAALHDFQVEYAKDNVVLDARGTRCLGDIHAHRGLMAETAGAYLLSAPNGQVQDFKQNGLQTGTVWLTIGYVFEDAVREGVEVSLLFVERMEREDGSVQDLSRRLWRNDTGARLAMAYTRFGFALEGTYRRQTVSASAGSAKDNLWRLGATIEYRLAGGVWLTTTFGKDFGFKSGETPLMALTNLQWNFDLQRGVLPDAKVTQ